MVIIGIIAIIIRGLWALGEGVRFLVREPPRQRKDYDKHSVHLWDLANGLELIGIVFGFVGIGRIQTSTNLIAWFGLGALICGIAIRWSAIHTLGKYFTGRVSIQPDHQLIRGGLYKYVRHPSYSGLLLAHAGLGLSLSNWFSLGFSVVPFLIAAGYRMRVEEAALQDTFGVAYLDYSKRVKRLVPKLY